MELMGRPLENLLGWSMSTEAACTADSTTMLPSACPHTSRPKEDRKREQVMVGGASFPWYCSAHRPLHGEQGRGAYQHVSEATGQGRRLPGLCNGAAGLRRSGLHGVHLLLVLAPHNAPDVPQVHPAGRGGGGGGA